MRRECGECLSLNCRWLKSSTAICMKCCPLVTLFQVLKFISSTWPETSSRLAAPTQLLWLHVAPLPLHCTPGQTRLSLDRAQCQVRLLWALVRLMLFAASRNISLQRRALQLPQTRCSCVRHAVPSAGMAAAAGEGEGEQEAACHCAAFEFLSCTHKISYENPLFQFMNFSKSSQ